MNLKEKIFNLTKQPSTWRGVIMIIGGIEQLFSKNIIFGITLLSAGIGGLFDDEIGKAAQEGADNAINDIKKHI